LSRKRRPPDAADKRQKQPDPVLSQKLVPRDPTEAREWLLQLVNDWRDILKEQLGSSLLAAKAARHAVPQWIAPPGGAVLPNAGLVAWFIGAVDACAFEKRIKRGAVRLR
jgi:hypothetical protein